MSDLTARDKVFIEKLERIVLDNLSNSHFGVKELANESGVGYYKLNRRIFAATKKKSNYFINEIRLRKAFEMLLNEDLTASEVAYKTGFSSPAYFNTSFHEFFGYPPGKVKKGALDKSSENPEVNVITVKESKSGILDKFINGKSWVFSISILVLLFLLIYPRILNKNSLDSLRSSDGRISVAVLPFQNLTDENIWDGLQYNIIGCLSDNPEELRVFSRDAINSLLGSEPIKEYASVTPSVAVEISKKLDAKVFVQGIINESGSIIEINAQLVNARTKEVLKAFEVNGPSELDKIFVIFDSLSVQIRNYLLKSKMEEEVSPDLKPYRYTDSPEAFRYFVLADDATLRGDLTSALDLYSKTVEADSNFIPAIIFLSMRYMSLGRVGEAKKWCLKAFEKRENANTRERIMVDWYYASVYSTPEDELRYLKQYLKVDDQLPIVYFMIGAAHMKLFHYEKAIPSLEKALDIYKKWGINPWMVQYYTYLAGAYSETGQYRKAEKLLIKAEEEFPDQIYWCYSQWISLSLNRGDTLKADSYSQKYFSVLKEKSWTDAKILSSLGNIYSEAFIFKKAEESFRKALLLDPENSDYKNSLAFLLIDRDLNIAEGLDLAEDVLTKNPEDYNYIHTKSWGLHKLGNSKEALVLIQKSWDLKPYYDHTLFLHMEEIKNSLSQ